MAEQQQEQLLTFTEKALARARQLQDKNPDKMLLFGTKRGGCSGKMYEITLAKEAKEGDAVVEMGGVKILIPKDSVDFLRGSTIDYKDTLMDAGFDIQNPNVKRSCGCGHSIG